MHFGFSDRSVHFDCCLPHIYESRLEGICEPITRRSKEALNNPSNTVFHVGSWISRCCSRLTDRSAVYAAQRHTPINRLFPRFAKDRLCGTLSLDACNFILHTIRYENDGNDAFTCRLGIFIAFRDPAAWKQDGYVLIVIHTNAPTTRCL